MESVQQLSLVKKIATIMGELGQIERTGEKKGKTQSGGEFEYDVFLEGDIVAPVQSACNRHNVAIIPNVVAMDRRDVPADKYTKHLVDVMVEFLIEDGDSGEQRTARMPGSAEERGDGSGVSKAITDANKNFLRKQFQLSARQEGKPTYRPTLKQPERLPIKPEKTAASTVSGETRTVVSHIFEVTEDIGKKTGAKYLWVEIGTEGKKGIENVICDDPTLFAPLYAARTKDAKIDILRKEGAKYPRITAIHEAQ